VIEINPEQYDADSALRAADEVMYRVKKSKSKKAFQQLN
jgi:diguanylate cyclase